MCGRVGFTDPDKVYEYYDIEDRDLDLKPRYNASPFQLYPVISADNPNKIQMMRWGFIPKWEKYKPLINAKRENLSTSKTYKDAFIHNRGVIPANFYLEWKKLADGSKQPHLFRLKTKDLFSIPAVILEDVDKEGNKVQVFCTITTEPNEIVSSIHDRSTAMFDKDKLMQWLNPDIVEAEVLQEVLDPYPSNKMETYIVSKEINSSKNDYPELIKPIPVQETIT